MAGINTDIENNSIDDKSFAILRTNPKLTSNIKVLVDSIGNIFLSAFRANKELSNITYQKFDIKESGIYSIDIANFYKGMPLTQRYDVLRTISDSTVYSDYEFQYEDQYQYGAIQNNTKLYGEQYRIFAPIWIEKKIPTKFVLYRIEGTDYKNEYLESTSGQNDRILELLKNATIIKTFDLSKSSKIGEYLNRHANDKRFPNSALTINFKEGSQSFFNGIDIVNGGFVNRAEQLDTYYTQVDYPEIFNNQTITQGFERNGIVSANIINLEFLFDDSTADNYKIYRYFGIYVDDIDEGSFSVNGFDPKGKLNVNKGSYKTLHDTMLLTDFDLLPNPDQFRIPSLQYIKDVNGNFYHVINSIKNILSYKFIISPNESSLESFGGFSKNGKKLVVDYSSPIPNYKGFITVRIKEVPAHGDRVFMGDKTEIEISQYNLGDYVIIADEDIHAGRAIGNRFSSKGSLQQIAIAFSSAINNGDAVTYKTHVVDTSIIIEEHVDGNKRRHNALGIYNSNYADFISVDKGELNNIGLTDDYVDSMFPGNDTLFIDWTIYTTVGGSEDGHILLIKSTEIGNVIVGEYINNIDSNKFIRIIEIERDPFNIEYYRVIFNSRLYTLNGNQREFDIYHEYKTIHGKFSAYDFKDFDFDFYSTRNSSLGDMLYDSSEIDLAKFYAGLNPVLDVESIEENTNRIILKNEYDRLLENNLKETSIISRVVPTICKFELKNASNARNLPYILNVNEAFGEDNLSPNININSGRNVEHLNMEYFHMNGIPIELRNGNASRDFNNYVDFADDGGITLVKLKDIGFDYFESHFNWNGYYDNVDNTWYDNTYKKLYSKFDNGNSEKSSSTVFRGLRYVFQKRKENINVVPTEFIKNVDISDYKFGVVMVYNTGQNLESNAIVITTVKNDVFKFICVHIELSVVQNNINQLNRYLMYTLKDIKLTVDEEEHIIDTKVPFDIDFQSSGFDGEPGNENKKATLNASSISISDGTARFKKHIKRDELGNYSWIYFKILGGDVYAVKVIDVVSDESIIVNGWPYKFNVESEREDSSGDRLNPNQFSLITSDVGETFKYKYLKGGVNEFANLLNEISAYQFASKFNTFNSINYITIGVDNSISNNDFSLSIESGVEIIKPSLIIAKPDPDRPKAYQLTPGEVGSIIDDRADGGYVSIIRRMNGDYNPLFNNIVSFSDFYSSGRVIDDINPIDYKLISYKKFNGLGLAFDSFKENKDDYGFINNYFYHKVNEQDSKNILKLSLTSDKLPLYPLIGEIAIDKKDLNIFKSKYSKDHFTKAISGGSSTIANGTLSPVEKKSFMASTIMKVRDTYDITKFTNTGESTIEALDKIRLVQANVNSIHWYEDASQVVADIYLSTAILDELIEDGIETYFGRYINAANSHGDQNSIKDDLVLYAKSNIYPRFIIDSINIYGIEGKGLITNFISVGDVSQLTLNGYNELTNFNIQRYQNDGLSFRLIYNKKLEYSYNFKIHIKLQA